jgi:adenylate cyclase
LLIEHFKRNWLRITLSCVILAVFALHVSHRLRWEFLHRLENIAYDARLRATMPRVLDDRIVIVDIDEASLMAQGRWPWSRNKMATLVDQLFDKYGVFLVAFDMVFAEAEEVSGINVLNALQDSGVDPARAARMQVLREDFDHDRVFANSLKGRRVIMGYFFSKAGVNGQKAPQVGTLPEPTFLKETFAGRAISFTPADGFGANLAALQENALSAGHFMVNSDIDGLVRRVPMLVEYQGNYYESLSLAVARTALGIDEIVPGFPESSRPGKSYTQLEWLQLGDVRIPVDREGKALVPFRGPQGSFPYVSASAVIDGTADEMVLRDRLVLVGTTAAGLSNRGATPVANAFPGVEIHANLISGIVGPKGQTGRVSSVMDNPAYTVGAEFVLMLATGLLMAIVLPALTPLVATLMTLVLVSGIVGANLVIWHWGNLVFPLAAGLVMILVLFLFNMVYGYVIEERGNRKLVG